MRSATDIEDMIVHHTAGPLDQTALEIDSFERTRGDIYMPYGYLIDMFGGIYDGRPDLAVSAASYGRNAQSIAVCLIGNFQSDDAGYTGPPSQKAIDALIELGVFLHKKYPSIERTIGHRDIAPMFFPGNQGEYATACPGNKLYELLPAIKEAIADGIGIS